MKSKFETLIEHILNDNEEAARELFHDIVVEKSRQIYTDLVAEESEGSSSGSEGSEGSEGSSSEGVEESIVDEIGGDAADDMMGDIDADEAGMDMHHAGEEGSEEGSEIGSEEGSEAGDEEIEDRVVDLEAALDELKAEFDKLMSHEEESHEEGSAEAGEEMPAEGVVREYVEKAPAPVKSETSANTKSIVAGKNDMGGTSANIAKGGANSAPDGTSAPKAAKSGDLPHSGNFENVPGGKAGDAFGKAKAPVSSEAGGTNTKSAL
jgi:hypothetical protein